MKAVRAIVGQETLPVLKKSLGWVVEVAAFMMETAPCTHLLPSRCQFTQSMNQTWSGFGSCLLLQLCEIWKERWQKPDPKPPDNSWSLKAATPLVRLFGPISLVPEQF